MIMEVLKGSLDGLSYKQLLCLFDGILAQLHYFCGQRMTNLEDIACWAILIGAP